MRAMPLFVLATCLPIPLIGLASLLGGVWVIAALFYMTGLTFLLDTLVRMTTPPTSDAEFPAATALSVTLAALHFPLMALVVAGLAGAGLSLAAKIALFLAAGLYFGQVGNANAHELIHRRQRPLHALGKWVYISLLFGHHTSAHVLVHHTHVATDNDPNTSRFGESYYAYAPRAWMGSFKAGLAAETARLTRADRSQWQNPYVVYLVGSAAFIALAFAIGGIKAAIIYIALAVYAQSQLLLSDYVQHYGLTREMHGPRPEPVGPRHSWNSPHWFSSALMLNAPRHSDHHAHPSRPYPELDIPDGAPMLPRALPTMATLALFPSLWFRVMNKRAAAWAAK